MKDKNDADDAKDANEATKRMFYVLFFAVTPFLAILFIYIKDPHSAFLYSIVEMTHNLPALWSSKNILLSKTMDVYCKSAPLFSLVFFVLSHRKIKIKKTEATKLLIRTLLMYLALYLVIIYIFLFNNHELTTSGKLIWIMSRNDFFLTVLYIQIFSGIYVFSCILLWCIFGTYNVWKERR